MYTSERFEIRFILKGDAVMSILRWTSVLAFIPVNCALGLTTTTVSYQNGVDGYSGTFDRRISDALGAQEYDGSTVEQYYVDGYAPEDPGGGGGSSDQQALIRFDNIFGGGAAQIPAGAFIIDAGLVLTTGPSGNSDSGGPFGVAALYAPFSSSTSYADYASSEPGGRGAYYLDNHATRWTDRYRGVSFDDVDSADVRSLVQLWSDGPGNGGLDNNGFVVQAGFPPYTTNGWQFGSSGNADPTRRPKLSVTYTTDPIEVNTFQRDLNGYTGDTMAWLRGPSTDVNMIPPETIDGTTLVQSFLDGPNTAGDSRDDIALLKFDNLFGTDAGQAPADAEVAKAWLVITTGENNSNAHTGGTYKVNKVLRDWTTSTLYTEFGATPGLQEADGDIDPTLDSYGFIYRGQEVWYDVTSYVEGVRTGEEDFGLAVSASGTSDGWQIHFNGSDVTTARPRLVIASDLSAPPEGLPGDFNDDGTVNAADYAVWRDNFGSSFDLAGNGDETGSSAGTVDNADYSLWSANFGNVADAAGTASEPVPEPGALRLVAVALLGLTSVIRRHGVGKTASRRTKPARRRLSIE